MRYPHRLLPSKNKKLIDISRLLKEGFFLVRRTDDEEILDEQTGQIKEKHVVLQTDHLRDYSTQLLGVFRPADFQFQFNRTSSRFNFFARELWIEGSIVDTPTEEDFLILNNFRYFFISIFHISRASISYLHSSTNVSISVQPRILHTATNGSFWHFSIRWRSEEGLYEEIEQKSHRRRILTSAKSWIKEHGRLEISDSVDIPEDFYRNS